MTTLITILKLLAWILTALAWILGAYFLRQSVQYRADYLEVAGALGFDNPPDADDPYEHDEVLEVARVSAALANRYDPDFKRLERMP